MRVTYRGTELVENGERWTGWVGGQYVGDWPNLTRAREGIDSHIAREGWPSETPAQAESRELIAGFRREIVAEAERRAEAEDAEWWD